MNKLLKLSLLTMVSLQAAEPMTPESMSTDRGGQKSAIDAYSDGGGAYLYDDKGRAEYDNSPMNNLVFKYGAEAKSSGASLRDQVKTLSQSTAEEKILADKIPLSSIAVNPPQDGTVCNDFNENTTNDRFVNGICTGAFSVFVSCKDILDKGGSNGDGVYQIEIEGIKKSVYCDMSNGGWTLVDSFASSEAEVGQYQAAYSGINISNASELSTAGYTTYLTNINHTVYPTTIKPGFMAFYYGSGPNGYIQKTLPNFGSEVKVVAADWYSASSGNKIYINGILVHNIPILGGVSVFQSNYQPGAAIKFSEGGIFNIGQVWVR